MKLYRALLTPLVVGAFSCADVPAAPSVAGVNLAEADFHPEAEGTLRLRVSVSDRYGYPWLDASTTRIYVRQLLLNGTAVRTITELSDDTSQPCGWARPVSGPTAVAFVVDRSGAGEEIDQRTVVRGVVEAALDAPDTMRVGVVNVGTTAAVDQGLTADRDDVEEALRAPSTDEGPAALYAGIEAGIDLIASSATADEHGAVVVVTSALNGVGGTSVSPGGVVDLARAAGVPVYVVAYGDATLGVGSDLVALDDIAVETGGRFVAGGESIYSSGVMGSVVSSIHAAYEVCVDALPVDHGDRYADVGDMSEIRVTVESYGSDMETTRFF